MNITIINIGHGLDEAGKLAVLNFTVRAEADTGEVALLDVSQIGGTYPDPATPREPIIEPVMEPIFEAIMEPIMEAIMEPTIEMVEGPDGELHEEVTGEHQVGERQIGERQIGERQVGERQVGKQQIGERQVGEKITGYTGGYTPEELLAIAETVATARGAYAEAEAQLAVLLFTPPVFVPLPVHVPTNDERKQLLADTIDNRVKFIYNRFMAFRMEYELREGAANAYKSAGYSGEPGDLVKRFADNIGTSYRAATDLILSQSANLRSAIPQLGNLRMDKYLVLKADSLESAQAAYDTTMSAIDAIDASLA